MKLSKKIRIISLLTVIVVILCSVSVSAAEKLDQNMSGADMTFPERLQYALQGSATGIIMIFAVLGLLWGIVSLSKFFLYDLPNRQRQGKKSERKTVTSAPAAQTPVQTTAPTVQTPAVQTPAVTDDGQLAAVITAAIAAMIESGDYKGEFSGGFRVVSFKRSTTRAWNKK